MVRETCPHVKALKELAAFGNQHLQATESFEDFDWWMVMMDVIFGVYNQADGPCTTWHGLVEGLPDLSAESEDSFAYVVRDKVLELDEQVQKEEQDYVERN